MKFSLGGCGKGRFESRIGGKGMKGQAELRDTHGMQTRNMTEKNENTILRHMFGGCCSSNTPNSCLVQVDASKVDRGGDLHGLSFANDLGSRQLVGLLVFIPVAV